MKRFAILFLLGILAALSVAPLLAQDATAEATEAPVAYDPATCFAAASFAKVIGQPSTSLVVFETTFPASTAVIASFSSVVDGSLRVPPRRN